MHRKAAKATALIVLTVTAFVGLSIGLGFLGGAMWGEEGRILSIAPLVAGGMGLVVFFIYVSLRDDYEYQERKRLAQRPPRSYDSIGVKKP